MRAAVAAAWVTGLLGLGAAGTSGAVEVLNAHANAPHANCAALVEKVSELRSDESRVAAPVCKGTRERASAA